MSKLKNKIKEISINLNKIYPHKINSTPIKLK